MTKKKDLIIAVLITFCLTATLFMIRSTRSETPTNKYDPMSDVNQDGSINILDAIIISNKFGSSGIPINWTQLLANYTELLANYSELEANYANYVASYKALQNEVNNRLWLYAQEMPYITPRDPLVNATVYNITGGWSNRSDFNEFWNGVRAIWDWVEGNIQYRSDGLSPILPADPSGPLTYVQDMWQYPNETMNLKEGDCEDQAILLCSMLRCYNYQQYWVECVWITGSNISHVGVQMPVTGNQLTILDPAGQYYSHDFWGTINSGNIMTEINSWLNYWGNNVSVYKVFSDYINKTFASTNDYLTWMYSR